ncbi:MAG TPA: thiamine-phosphate kinase [Candidatus Dormibacteraeota bacterium]
MTVLRELGELGLLRRLLPHLSQRGGAVLIGAGEDDTAAWRERDGSITVATCDTFVEGVHFDLAWMPAETAGWRACALTLADLSAKAARPAYGLVALSAAPATPVDTVEGIYEGLAGCAREYDLRLVGGDSSSTPGPLTITVFALGRASWEPLPRSSAQPSWKLGLTGPLGGEALALAERRPTRPRPRFGELAPGCACGDVSDGLLRELAKFRAAAGVGARIDSRRVPVAAGASVEQALTGGEEVELLCAWPGAPREGLTMIGSLTADGRILVDDVEREDGYDHFG